MNRKVNNDHVIQVAKEAVSAEARAVTGVADSIDDSLADVMELLLSRTGRVVVVGSGTSGTIARRLAHLLSVSGTPAFYIHPMDALHGTMGAVESEDTLMAFSKGGESDEINRLAALLKARGVAIVGIGETPTSTLAGLSDVFVTLHTPTGGDPQGILAMGSTLVAAAWGDALTRALMDHKGWEVEQSLDMHPAGAVGKLAEARAQRCISANPIHGER